jgi:hypothetical protein
VRYELDQFGLDRPQLRDMFAFYTAHFGIAEEP